MPDSSTQLSELLVKKPQAKPITPRRSPTVLTSDSDEATVENCCRIAPRPVMMIRFRMCSGEFIALPYPMLKQARSDDADRSFELRFAGGDIHSVTVEGQNLWRLFDYVCHQRVIEISESDRTVAMNAADGDWVVTKLSYK